MRREILPLTGLRAVAAWGVVLFHFLDQLRPTGLYTEVLVGALHFGSNGVDLFFMLSGFVIALTYGAKFERPAPGTYRDFLVKRLARIYPAHAFALFGLLLLTVALAVVTGSTTFFNQNSAGEFMGQLLLVGNWNPLSNNLTWNVPAWSISCEWLAYLCFPLVWFGTGRLSSRGLAMLCVLLPLLMALVAASGRVNDGLVRITTEFVTGVCLFRLSGVLAHPAPWGAIGLIAGLLYVVLGVALGVQGANVRLAVVLLVPLLFSVALERGVLSRVLARPGLVYWGRVSYSLYITHYPCLAALKFLFALPLFARSPVLLLALCAVQFALIAAAAVFTYHFVEEPARKVIVRRFGRRRAPLVGV